MKNNNKITKLVIMSAMTCNLNCEYCEIYKSKIHSNPKALEQLIIDTNNDLDNGQFLQNILTTFERLKINPRQITMIEIWGQEPTINLEHISDHIGDWLNSFPAVHSIFFSTNGVAYTDKILKFAQAIDAVVDQHFDLRLQFSYDGEYSTTNSRKADATQIQKNIIWLINELEKIHLNSTNVSIGLHGVLSRDLINSLDSLEKVNHYFKQIDDYIRYIFDNIPNKLNNVIFDSRSAIIINQQSPIPDATITDGINLARFYRFALSINFDNFITKNTIILGMLQIYRGIANCLKDKNNNIQDLEIAAASSWLSSNAPRLRPAYCGTNIGTIRIMHDGTIINCQNNIFSTNLDIISDDNDIVSYVRKNNVLSNIYPNGVTDSIEALEKYFNLYEYTEDAFYHIVNINMSLMKNLAEVGQISQIYLIDNNKLLRDAIMLALSALCGHDNYLYSGSLYITLIGKIRLYCNGFLDIIYQVIKSNVIEDIDKREDERCYRRLD